MAAPIILNSALLSENQQACVDLLRETLTEAERGAINTIGIVACMAHGYATVMAGSHAGDLNLGCDSLKRKILAAIEDDGNVKKPSRIMRAK